MFIEIFFLFFFIFTHFSALRKDRDADYLMAIVVVNNPLFDKIRNLSLVQPAGDVKAIDGSSSEGEIIAPKEKVPLRRTASRSADCSKTKGKKVKATSRTSPEKDLKSDTDSERITRSRTRNQLQIQLALTASTTHHSNEELVNNVVDESAIGKVKQTEESDQESILPGDVATLPASRTKAKYGRPPRLTGPGVQSTLPVGVHQEKSSAVIRKTSSQAKGTPDATIFPAGIQQSVSGEESNITRPNFKTGGKLGKTIVDTPSRALSVTVEDCKLARERVVNATASGLSSEIVVPEEGQQLSGDGVGHSPSVGILKQNSSTFRVTSSTKAEQTPRAAKSSSAESQTGRQRIIDKSSHVAVKTLSKKSNAIGKGGGCARLLVATSTASRPTAKTLVPEIGLEPSSGSGVVSTPPVDVVRSSLLEKPLKNLILVESATLAVTKRVANPKSRSRPFRRKSHPPE